MNFPTLYYQTQRPDLASRAFDVLYAEPLPVPDGSLPGADVVCILINAYRRELRYHLMGFTRHHSRTHKAAIGILNQGDEFLPLINQVNTYLLDELIQAELYEIVPKLLGINRKLADKIEQTFPHIDVSPLRDTDNARQEMAKLLKKLDEFKKSI